MPRIGIGMAWDYEPPASIRSASVSGIGPSQVGELLQLILDRCKTPSSYCPFRPPAVGDPVRSWDSHRIIEIWCPDNFPIVVGKIDTGLDGQGSYRDIYHFEGEGWFYQLRHRPDILYPDGMDNPLLHRAPVYQRWNFEGDEAAFARDLVHAKLLLIE